MTRSRYRMPKIHSQVEGWQAMSPGPAVCFENKVLLEHNQTYLSTYCLWQLLYYNGRQN